MLSLFHQSEKQLLQRLSSLPSQDLIHYYETVGELFDANIPSKSAILQARLLRAELIRRLQTGWKIALIYNAFDLQPDRLTVLLDDPGIKRSWQSRNFGYMKRNQFFLRNTKLTWVELQGQQNEISKSIGDYLLSKRGQRITVNFTAMNGPVLPQQDLFSGNSTKQVVLLSIDDIFLPAPVLENPNLYSVATTVEVTIEAQAYLDMLQQLNGNVYI